MEKNYIILIPSHNELDSLRKIYSSIKKANLNCLVVDDNSIDNTNLWLKKNNATFLKNKEKMGYEKSLIIGFKHILKKFNYEYIVTFDADGEHKVKDLKKIINFHKKTKPDILICNRLSFNRWSEFLLSFFFNLILEIKDPLSGLKLYNSLKLNKIIKKIKNDMYLVDIIKIFKDKKYEIINYEINVDKRIGESKVGKNIRVHMKILSLVKLIF